MDYTALDTQLGGPTVRTLGKDNRSIRSVESADFPYAYNRALWTRNCCIAGLILCWLAGIATEAYSIYIFCRMRTAPASDQPLTDAAPLWRLPHMVAEGIPLAINVVVTLLVESTGYIHTASLRWALLRDDKLRFNSNLRLLSSSRTSKPNKWYSNLVVLAFITLAYASSSLTFLHSNKAADFISIFGLHSDYASLDIIPFWLLGSSFLGLAMMSTWALCSVRIPSWSSSPLDTAFAALQARNIHRRERRCMRSVHDQKLPAEPTRPRQRQKRALTAHWEVKWIFLFLWGLVIACFAWSFVTGCLITATSQGTSMFGRWALVPDKYSSQFSVTLPIDDVLARSVAIIVLYAIAQSSFTIGLHCAELESNLSRDEAFWRTATKPEGCRLEEYDSIKAAFTSWQSIILFIFKTVLHWVFGLCIQVQDGQVGFFPVQIMYLGGLSALCALFVTYLCMARPNGAQPAAYGHLQTLVDLVDDWSAVLYWGHKSDGLMVSHAGTAPYSLLEVKEALYSG
jgi:hypothetical protein